MSEPMIYLDWDGLEAAACPPCAELLRRVSRETTLAVSPIWREMCPDDLNLVSMHALAKLRQARAEGWT